MSYMTDDILGKKNRQFEPNRKPILVEWREDMSKVDPELKRLHHVIVKSTDDNREYCFWSDSISQTITYMTAATIIGDGLRINCQNEKAKNIIESFNKNINVNRQSIEDYITSTWIDEIVHGHSYWRIEMQPEMEFGVDLQRIDPKTIKKKFDKKYGWQKFIQTVPDYKSYRSKSAFYARASLHDKDFDQVERRNYWRVKEIHIPDEPDVLLRTNFFVRPPLGSAVHYITYKRYILYFMRKYSQKFWTPFLLFLVGDPMTNYYPDNDEDMEDSINDIAEVAPNMVNFGSLVLPGNIRAQELGKQSARSSDIYINYMDALDKQIALALYSSMGLRSASGSELSTQRGIKETVLSFVQNIRRKYKIGLENFYISCLLPANGIILKSKELDVEYSPLKFEASEEIMRAIDLGRKTGMFKDRNELRKAGQAVWTWLADLPENPKVDFSIPYETGGGGGMFGGGDTRSKEQATKQKVKPVASTTNV